MTIQSKLESLRRVMRKRGLSAYIVTSGDAHAGEYSCEYWAGRRWLSGFTGSSGLLVVTADKAGLWTDSRYWLQAERELAGTGITLFKDQEKDVPKYHEWARDNVAANAKIGLDGRTITDTSMRTLYDTCKPKGITFEFDDLLGEIWEDRPAFPSGAAFVHPLEFAGESAKQKLVRVREKMRAKSIDALLLPALDDVAWLTNLRGYDVPYMPVVNAFALVTLSAAHLFIDPGKVDGVDGFTLHGYDELPAFLAGYDGAVHYNPGATNVLLLRAIKDAKKLLPADDIVLNLKAAKTVHEQANTKDAYIAEGVALVKALRCLDEGGFENEGAVNDFLLERRKENPLYVCDAFPTIAAYGANAAQAHYRAEGAGANIEKRGFLLIDTGGQYMNGTTDTTRTVFLGNEPTPEEKLAYTLVLKGHIALSNAIFPQGTTGIQLDVLARAPMWVYGRNFRHGTGHGVGYCLSVHERPQHISPHPTTVALQPGMLLSNEPALYKDGEYGIRTENVLLANEFQKTDDGTFLWFETLTVCPVCTRAIDLALLTPFESLWLDHYHKYVFDTLSPLLTDAGDVEWLRKATQPLPVSL